MAISGTTVVAALPSRVLALDINRDYASSDEGL